MKNAAKVIDQKTIFFDALKEHLPEDQVSRIRTDAKRRLAKMYTLHPDLPKGVGMHVYNFIFPSAAIYLAIKAENEDIAYAVMEKCMREKSSKMGESLRKMSRIPGFSRFFMSMWDPVSHKMFGPSSGFKNVFYKKEKNEYRMDILSCPYCRYLTKVGCPELTVLFCKNDEYSYGNMEGLRFIRTQTLGSGGEKCDFKLVLEKK